jgi:hypothetical protein
MGQGETKKTVARRKCRVRETEAAGYRKEGDVCFHSGNCAISLCPYQMQNNFRLLGVCLEKTDTEL